ncbi:putative 2OG-Fe(II) oxygenase [Erythrobacter sp. YT30]|uniref:putative 2OG-Fe(II) oxygenase n=1 Tax=Erythrobacter sp. YT30 TaxID=1735012 RepID=UPI00076BF4E6|nr:putative 2OG-Fe(II) oxygenase [Erythrobacter sp. YT30]KWV90364.1 hypothetical protein AUC45_13905 [Erythrobacter sp. YT30]
MSNPASDSQIAEWDAMVRSANAKRKSGDVAEAAREFDGVLAAHPRHPAALHGRARLALARGEADALNWFDRALKADPRNADLWLGKAQALDVAGDAKGAQIIARQICEQAPGFIAALEFLAGLRIASNEDDFAQDFRIAAKRIPQDPNIPATHVDALAGLDYAGAAADVAHEARQRFPNEPHFALLEAANASASGQWDRAETIFADLKDDRPARLIQEARHRVRASDWSSAQALLERVLAQAPWSIAAWALLSIIWRKTTDDRAEWLHEQTGLVQLRPLKARVGLLEEATDMLRTLHKSSAMPLSQSLRGGTQTRGVLFHRKEQVFAELQEAIRTTLEEYRRELPLADGAHPLLRHRDSRWTLAGSWSVRLAGGSSRASAKGDHHASHIHPSGIISSALYCAVPEAIEDDRAKQGWLELGRPPADLGLDLKPVRTLKPVEGHLALFPSTLYHGTTPFTAENSQGRITTAFDVVSYAT